MRSRARTAGRITARGARSTSSPRRSSPNCSSGAGICTSTPSSPTARSRRRNTSPTVSSPSGSSRRPASPAPASSLSSRAAGRARWWRCAPTWTACRSGRGRRPLRQQGDVEVRRAGRRGDARVRARHAHGDPAGDGPRPDATSRIGCPGTVMFIFQPAEEGAPADRAPGRRRADGQGRRAGQSEGRRHFRPARLRQRAVRPPHLSQRLVHGRRRRPRDHRQGAPDAWLDAVARRRSGAGRLPDRHGAAVDRQPQRRHHAAAGGRHDRAVSGRRPQQHHPGHGAAGRHDPHVRPAVQDDIHARIKRIAEGIASGAGATVEVKITKNTPVTSNNPTSRRECCRRCDGLRRARCRSRN